MMVLGLGLLLAWLRWRETKQLKWAALVGACAGWAAIVRPVDALAFAIPVGVAMLLDFRGMPPHRVGMTIGLAILAALPFMSLQLILNKGTTGSITHAPHTLYLNTDQPDTTYGFHAYHPDARPQSKLLQKTVYYRGFMLPDVQKHQIGRIGAIAWERLKLTFDVALPTPLLLIFVFAGTFALTDRPRKVVVAVPLVFFVLYLPYTFYMEHYVVPIIVPMLLLAVLGAQRIATIWKQPTLHRKLERTLVAVLAFIALASLPELNPRVRDDLIFAPTGTILRQAIRDRVKGPAVVLVRYHASDNPHDEPVYNDAVAWPDDADVIVAHDLGARNMELLDYYERTQPGRRYYLFDREGFKLQGPGSAADLARAIEKARQATTTTTTTSKPAQ
jgi:4-amino-4-deoxy-L-arabinose transferase-like glycosyltransferase